MKEQARVSTITTILLIVIAVMITASVMYFLMSNDKINNIWQDNNEEVIEQKEEITEVSFSKAEEMFEWLPKIYENIQKPFDDQRLLQIVMKRINTNAGGEKPDFSESNINKVTHELFGANTTINKERVTDLSDVAYYYSSDEKAYTVIAFGTEGVFLRQILKSATQTTKEIYIEAYMINGEIGIGMDDEGELEIKDKNGETIKTSINEYTPGEESKEIVQKYKDRLSVIKYTLQKDNGSYYILKTEMVK